jgi:hypothetical protein
LKYGPVVAHTAIVSTASKNAHGDPTACAVRSAQRRNVSLINDLR